MAAVAIDRAERAAIPTPTGSAAEHPVLRLPTGIVDCDVHVAPKSVEEIRSRMGHPWSDMLGPSTTSRGFYWQPNGNRIDSVPPGGGKPASDPDFLREQLVRPYNVSTVICAPRSQCTVQPNPDFGAAIAAAYNEWQADTWLGAYNHDGMFKGSILIPTQDPGQAVREIDKWAGHPHFVQVLVDSGARLAYGQRYYWPIYEACERHNLPFALHPGTEGMGINPPPGPGYPTHYVEWATDFALSYMAHLVSFITEGVFERFPGLRVGLIEGGVAWVAPLLWRLEDNWKPLRFEVPWVKRRPGEYVREHVRFASQPLERPENKEHLIQALAMMDAEHTVMFSSDYPHWNFDSPIEVFPRNMPESWWRPIFHDNAKAFYRL